MAIPISEIRIITRPALLRANRLTSTLHVVNVSVCGKREAKGKAIIINPFKVKLRLFCDERMLSYDFSKNTVVDPSITNKPFAESYRFKPASGKTIKEIVAESTGNIIFACNGETDNLQASNSVVIADGKIIKRTAPGVNSAKFAPLNSIFPFFVFDAGKTGIFDLAFKNGDLKTRLTFQNGIRGFVLIRNGKKQDHLIRHATPNIKPDEATWDPQTKKAAMTAFGRNAKREIILISLAGHPEKENELTVSDITDVLLKLGAVDAVLGGLSGDVQQYIRLSDSKEYWLTAKPGITSSMAKMFPEGRPLSNAIIIED